MHSRDLARISQAEAGAVLLYGFALVECFEDEFALVLRHVGAVVLDLDHHVAVLLGDLAVDRCVGILDGVGEEVAHDALDGVGVARNHYSILRERGLHLKVARLGRSLERVDGLPDNGADVLRRHHEAGLAAVHLAEVQQVVAELLEALHVQAHRLHILLHPVIELALRDGLVQ